MTVTLPVAALRAANVAPGDRLRVEVVEDGVFRLVRERDPVLAEVLVRAYRVGDDVGAANERDLVGLFGPVRVIDRDVVTATAQLRARHRALRLADAFVIATGLVDRATTLTYDRRLASVHPSVRVLAP